MADDNLHLNPPAAHTSLTLLERRVESLERRMGQRLAYLPNALTLAATIVLALMVLVSCNAVTTPPLPAPYADVAPEPQPQLMHCALAGGDAKAFTLACSEPPATPEPTPTVAPVAFWYFFCPPGQTCEPFRVYWDPQRKFLRCAVDASQSGMKVTLKAMMAPDREIMVPLAWVVTGQLLANGEACEGWVDQGRLAPAR